MIYLIVGIKHLGPHFQNKWTGFKQADLGTWYFTTKIALDIWSAGFILYIGMEELDTRISPARPLYRLDWKWHVDFFDRFGFKFGPASYASIDQFFMYFFDGFGFKFGPGSCFRHGLNISQFGLRFSFSEFLKVPSSNPVLWIIKLQSWLIGFELHELDCSFVYFFLF